MTVRPANDAGFTLVEVLLAVLIAGLVMVGSYSVASQVMRLSEDAKARLELESTVEIARTALADDLESIIFVERSGRAASSSMDFYGGQDTTSLTLGKDKLLVSLATAATLDPGAPFPSHGFYRVEYVVRPPDDGAKDKGDMLVRRELPYATITWRDGAELPWRETVLVRDISGVKPLFYENAQASPTPNWDSRARQNAGQSLLPAQFRLSATITAQGQKTGLDVRVSLPPRTLSPGGGS